MSDRIAVFNMGECQQVGTPTEIYNEPINDFVAEFIGETNLINVAYDQAQGDKVLYHCGAINQTFTVNDTEMNIAPYEEGDDLFVSIRPEIIQIHEKAIEKANVFKGTVSLVQFTGEAVHTYIKLNEATTFRVTDLNHGPSTYLKEGTEVFIHVPTEHIRVVPKARSEK